MPPTVTRADLITAIQERAGIARPEAGELLESLLEELQAAIARRELVKLSRFGNFVVRHKHERVGRNPKTGQSAAITPRWVVTFRPSQILRRRVERRPPQTGSRGRRRAAEAG